MLTKEELEQLDERYVKQTNCDEYRAAIVEANRQQDVLLSAINAKMSFLLVLGAVLKLLIGG